MKILTIPISLVFVVVLLLPNIVFHKYTCTALSVELLDDVRTSTPYSKFSR